MAERPAPPPIMIALPKPAAVPASFGLIDIMAAVALGIDIPFPRPTSVMKPKNDNIDPLPKKLIVRETETPNNAVVTPKKIILSNPILVENLPDKKFPNM